MNYQKLACLGGSLALALLAPACGGDDDNNGKNKDGGIPVADGGIDAPLVCPAGGTGQVKLAVVVPCDVAGSTASGDAGAPDGGSVDAGSVDGGDTGCTITLTTAGSFTPQVRLNGGSLAAPAAFALGQALSVTAGPNFVLEARRVTTHPAAGSAAIVGKAFTPTLMPFDGCIKAGEMRTVTVVYTQEPGSEKIGRAHV